MHSSPFVIFVALLYCTSYVLGEWMLLNPEIFLFSFVCTECFTYPSEWLKCKTFSSNDQVTRGLQAPSKIVLYNIYQQGLFCRRIYFFKYVLKNKIKESFLEVVILLWLVIWIQTHWSQSQEGWQSWGKLHLFNFC